MFRKVSIKDLMKFYSCSERTAVSRMKEISSAIDKKRVSIYDLAIYEGYPPIEIEAYLSEY